MVDQKCNIVMGNELEAEKHPALGLQIQVTQCICRLPSDPDRLAAGWIPAIESDRLISLLFINSAIVWIQVQYLLIIPGRELGFGETCLWR